MRHFSSGIALGLHLIQPNCSWRCCCSWCWWCCRRCCRSFISPASDCLEDRYRRRRRRRCSRAANPWPTRVWASVGRPSWRKDAKIRISCLKEWKKKRRWIEGDQVFFPCGCRGHCLEAETEAAASVSGKMMDEDKSRDCSKNLSGWTTR